MNVFDKLFIPHDEQRNDRNCMHNAYVSLLKMSTWYSCQEIKGYPSACELSLIANNIIYYVLTRGDKLYENEGLINYKGEDCRISVVELASFYSSDLVFESAYAAFTDNSLDFFISQRDRLSAAFLFRYKYCCVHEKLFQMSWILQWERIAKSINNISDKKNIPIDALFDAFTFLEAWSDNP